MTIALVINGITFNYPEEDDEDWGPEATDWAAAVTSGMLQKAGGTFTLTADADFGANFGLKSLYYKTRTADLSSTGQFRLAKTDTISWRNNANGADLPLGIDALDRLVYNGVVIGVSTSGDVVGPASATANAIALFDSTTGKLIKDGGIGTSSQVLVGGTTPGFGDTPAASLPIVTQSTRGSVASAGQLLGTNTNDNASSGNVGEEVVSSNSSGLSSAVNSFFNITSISITAGDWDIVGQVTNQAFSIVTGIGCFSGVSIYSGNTTTDHVAGDNILSSPTPGASNADSSITVAGYRLSVSGTTTVYLKTKCSATSGSVYALGRISARRVR